jgi:hypothetical protein
MDRFDDSVHDATADLEFGWNILAAKRAEWGLGPGTTSSSMMVFGMGILLLIAVGAGIIMLVASAARSTEGTTSTRSDSMASRRETVIPGRRMAG